MFDILDSGSKAEDRQRLSRIEAKINLILDRLGIECQNPAEPDSLSDEVRALADAGKLVDAIKVHRRQTGAGLREAKQALDAYLA